jgi:hypothetical protein
MGAKIIDLIMSYVAISVRYNATPLKFNSPPTSE